MTEHFTSYGGANATQSLRNADARRPAFTPIASVVRFDSIASDAHEQDGCTASVGTKLVLFSLCMDHHPLRPVRPEPNRDPRGCSINRDCSDHDKACPQNRMDLGRGNWRGLATEGDPHKEADGYQEDEEHSEGDRRVV